MAKKSRGNMRWARQDERVAKGRDWKTKPGYKMLIANKGEVRFDFPEPWIVNFGDDSIRITDRESPDDDCLLQLSVHYLPFGVDLSGLPVRTLVQNLRDERERGDDESEVISKGEVISVTRSDVDIAWFEQHYIDKDQQKEAISRLALARAKHIQALITFDFWPQDLKRCEPVWNEVLRSLRVGENVQMVEPPPLPLPIQPTQPSLLNPFATPMVQPGTDAFMKRGTPLSAKAGIAQTGQADAIKRSRQPVSYREGETLSLPENHGWRSDPGYKIFIANRGEVRFDYPQDWEIDPTPPITLRDLEPPADTRALRLFIYHQAKHQKTPAPITEALMDLIAIARADLGDEDAGYDLGHREPVVVEREDLELAWRQVRMFDPKKNREVLVRSAAARAGSIIALLIFTFPNDDLAINDPIWETMLRSIQLGNFIDDPQRHVLH